MTEKLAVGSNQLAVGWQVKRLGDLLKLQYGKPLPKEERDDEGAYPAYGANGIKCRTNKFYWDRPSIIVGRKGSAGEVNLTEEKFWPLDVTYFVEFDESQHDLMFLYYYLASQNLQSLAKGVKPGINRNDVYAIECAYPPLPEQKCIVAILDEAFAGISQAVANAEKNLANARELFESYLNNVFTSNDESTFIPLSELTTDITDGDHSAPPKVPEGIPFITISNINKKTHVIDFTNTFKVPEDYFKSLKSNRSPRDGDVLFTVTGSYGIPVKVPDDVKFCFQRHIGLLRPKIGVNSSWLYYALLSPIVFRQATEGATGTAQKTVSLKVLRSIRVPIMSQKEQELAIKDLDKIWSETQHLETIYQQKLTALAELKQSILQKAFAGQLTRRN